MTETRHDTPQCALQVAVIFSSDSCLQIDGLQMFHRSPDPDAQLLNCTIGQTMFRRLQGLFLAQIAAQIN